MTKRNNVVVVTDDSLFFVKKSDKNTKYTYVNVAKFTEYLKNNSSNIDVLVLKPQDNHKTCTFIPTILKYNLSKKTIIIANIKPDCRFANYMYFKIHCILKRPVDNDQLECAINEIFNNQQHDYHIFLEIASCLKTFGISPKYNGYTYLRDSIYLRIQERRKSFSLTKYIYQIVSEEYDTKSSTVESAIRRAIFSGWKNIKAIEEIFKYSININKEIATNKEFIETIAEKVISKIQFKR